MIIHLGDNVHPTDWSFFNSLVNCTNLKAIRLFNMGLRGELPNSIVNLSTTMDELYLNENQISGSIPREIGKLVNLVILSLAYNKLTGNIPESVGELSKLGLLDLYNNNISGVIPAFISNITRLVDINFGCNILQGSIPPQLFNITTLQKLNLSNNKLRGVIPAEILRSSQCFQLYLSINPFTGSLPSSIGSLIYLVILSLSYNKFTGDIPPTLGGCVMLEGLYLEGNLLQGSIPSSFEALRSLAFLDMSNNNISGSIPSFFDEFHLIIFLDLSHNKLEGEVSKQGIFSNFSAFSIIENSELCGGIEALHLPACPVKVLRNKKKAFVLRKILIPVLPLLAILLACFALILYRRQTSRKLNEPVPLLEDNQYLKLSYQDLLQATNEFPQAVCLGKETTVLFTEEFSNQWNRYLP